MNVIFGVLQLSDDDIFAQAAVDFGPHWKHFCYSSN